MKRKIMALFVGFSLLSSSLISYSQENLINMTSYNTQSVLKPKVIRTISTDLDGNGSKESISLTYHSAYYAILKINKIEVVLSLCGIGDPDALDLRVVDLIKSDKTKQLEFRELTTDIYARRELLNYNNGTISFIVLPSPADPSMTVNASYDGKGTITHAYVNQNLYTWFYKESFKYDGKTVTHISKSSYTLDTNVTISTAIKLQKSPKNKDMAFKTTKGMKLTIVETDGKGWFKVKNSSGQTGWFYFDDKTNKIQGKPGVEVFKGLPYAG